MKISFKYIAIALLTVLISCNDATDIIQPGTLTEDKAYETVDDLNLGLNGAYGAYGANSIIQFNSVFTDNIKRGNANNGQYLEQFQWTLTITSPTASNIWFSRYNLINRVNRVLRGLDNIDIPEERQEEANSIKGQMLALRALSHFELLQYYTEDYLNPESLAVPIIDFVPPVDINADRNTVAETFDFIYNDLENARELLAGGSTDDQFYINENSVDAIKARVALFRGDYELAGNLADELVNKYPLANPSDYVEIFTDDGFEEVIWSLARGAGEGQIGSIFFFNEPNLGGDPIVEMSEELFNQFNDDDIRKTVNVGETSVPADNDYIINKYPGSVENLVNDYKIFRSSEMLLIRAEAEARAGNLSAAESSIAMLQDIRFTANVPADPSYGNLNDALQDILEERRIELSFEAHRFLDIKRIGEDLGTDITRIAGDCTSFSAASECTLPRTSFKFTLPIPDIELNANPGITQNTGY